MDESVFIDFRSDSDVSQPEREPDSEQEEVFEFSSEISSGSLVIGTQQLEATVMDMSPRRLRRYYYHLYYYNYVHDIATDIM